MPRVPMGPGLPASRPVQVAVASRCYFQRAEEELLFPERLAEGDGADWRLVRQASVELAIQKAALREPT